MHFEYLSSKQSVYGSYDGTHSPFAIVSHVLRFAQFTKGSKERERYFQQFRMLSCVNVTILLQIRSVLKY